MGLVRGGVRDPPTHFRHCSGRRRTQHLARLLGVPVRLMNIYYYGRLAEGLLTSGSLTSNSQLGSDAITQSWLRDHLVVEEVGTATIK